MNDNGIYINHPLLKENKVIRRAYQENVFISCINSNCLVIIPTGLGKTIIALILAIYKLSKFEDLKVETSEIIKFRVALVRDFLRNKIVKTQIMKIIEIFLYNIGLY